MVFIAQFIQGSQCKLHSLTQSHSKTIAEINLGLCFFFSLSVGVLSILHKVYCKNLGRTLLRVASESIKS